ncbi:MAG: hypothetical protein WCA37_16605 [Terracidiphilus sp.]
MVEAAVKIMSAQIEDMASTPEEAAKFLDTDLDLVDKEHGTQALNEITNAVGFAKDMLAERLKEYGGGLPDEGRDSGIHGGEPEGRRGGDREPLARKAGAESAGTAEPTHVERAEEDGDGRPEDGEVEKEEKPRYAYGASDCKQIVSRHTPASFYGDDGVQG